MVWFSQETTSSVLVLQRFELYQSPHRFMFLWLQHHHSTPLHQLIDVEDLHPNCLPNNDTHVGLSSRKPDHWVGTRIWGDITSVNACYEITPSQALDHLSLLAKQGLLWLLLPTKLLPIRSAPQLMSCQNDLETNPKETPNIILNFACLSIP